MNTAKLYHLGVEWVGDQIRAGVFDERGRLAGKASRSAKRQRGFSEVLKRIARCALDAVDEADLQPGHIAASAILTDGEPGGQTLGPEEINQLAGHLPLNMGAKLLQANRVPVIMWAVHEFELFGNARSWFGLFSEPAPQLVSADRAVPGDAAAIPVSSWITSGDALDTPSLPALPDEVRSAVCAKQPEFLLLAGPEFKDAKAGGASHVLEWLAANGLSLPLVLSSHGSQVGAWSAAQLAARTFSAW